ncbi:hypothetical protein BUE80_DR011617, partial [Diplocarpon rosae]
MSSLDQRLTLTFSILGRPQGAAQAFLDEITKSNHVATFSFIEKESFINQEREQGSYRDWIGEGKG